MHLHQLRDDLLRVTAVVSDRCADLESGELHDLREHMRERKVKVSDLARQEGLDLEDDRAQRHCVAVRQQAPLRRARRPGSEDHQCGVVRSHRLAAARELLPVTARRRDVFHCEHPLRSRLNIEDEDRAQRRERSADRVELRELHGVLNNDRDRPGVRGHPRALLGRVRRIDRDHDSAGAPERVGRNRPLRTCVRQDAHTLPWLDTHHPAWRRHHHLRCPSTRVWRKRPVHRRAARLRKRAAARPSLVPLRSGS